jgi:peroxin-7
MLKYKSDFQGYSCKFSPFLNNIIGCCFNQYYGIIGNGKLSIFSFTESEIMLKKEYKTNEAIFDISFSEIYKNYIISCQGDGTIKLWDFSNNNKLPLFSIKQHEKEIWNINWSHLIPNLILSCGSDKLLKITDVQNGKVLNTFNHNDIIYSCNFHPTLSNVISSSSKDKSCKLFDIKSNKEIKSFNSNYEILTCDFNKYDNLIGLGYSNGIIQIYDLRKSDIEVITLNGHNLCVKKIIFSPFDSKTLISVSYDMNVNYWNISYSIPIHIFNHHNEFVYGCDFSLFNKNLISTTSWDNSLCLFNLN